jgi:hypothetical protein
VIALTRVERMATAYACFSTVCATFLLQQSPSVSTKADGDKSIAADDGIYGELHLLLSFHLPRLTLHLDSTVPGWLEEATAGGRDRLIGRQIDRLAD